MSDKFKSKKQKQKELKRNVPKKRSRSVYEDLDEIIKIGDLIHENPGLYKKIRKRKPMSKGRIRLDDVNRALGKSKTQGMSKGGTVTRKRKGGTVKRKPAKKYKAGGSVRGVGIAKRGW